MRSLDELDRTLRGLEDRRAVDELTVRFAIAADDGDYRMLHALLAEDVVFEFGPGAEVIGPDAVVAHVRARLSTMTFTLHTVHQGVTTFVGDDEAVGVVPCHAEVVLNGTTIAVAARYYDRYVRRGASWLLARRRIATFYAMPLDDLPRLLPQPLRVRWPGTEPAPAGVTARA